MKVRPFQGSSRKGEASASEPSRLVTYFLSLTPTGLADGFGPRASLEPFPVHSPQLFGSPDDFHHSAFGFATIKYHNTGFPIFVPNGPKFPVKFEAECQCSSTTVPRSSFVE